MFKKLAILLVLALILQPLMPSSTVLAMTTEAEIAAFCATLNPNDPTSRWEFPGNTTGLEFPRSGITLPMDRRLTDTERANWMAEYLEMGSFAFEQQTIQLVNEVRSYFGFVELRVDDTHMMAARFYAQTLATLGTLSHTAGPYNGSSGVGSAFGVPPSRRNGAAGSRTPETLVAGWMNSTGHCENLLNPGIRYIGVGSHWSGVRDIVHGQYFGVYHYKFLTTAPSTPTTQPTPPGETPAPPTPPGDDNGNGETPAPPTPPGDDNGNGETPVPPTPPGEVDPDSIEVIYDFLDSNSTEYRLVIPAAAVTEEEILVAVTNVLNELIGLNNAVTVNLVRQENTVFTDHQIINITIELRANPIYIFVDSTIYFRYADDDNGNNNIPSPTQPPGRPIRPPGITPPPGPGDTQPPAGPTVPPSTPDDDCVVNCDCPTDCDCPAVTTPPSSSTPGAQAPGAPGAGGGANNLPQTGSVAVNSGLAGLGVVALGGVVIFAKTRKKND